MASSDERDFDEGPGEPDEGVGGPREDPGGDLGGLRGWVPPDQRAWRHPSEIGAWSGVPAYRPGSPYVRPAGRRTAWATGLVGAGAVAALVTGGLMLATHSRPGPITTVTSVSPPPVSAARSIVRLDVQSSASSSFGCGVVVAAGGMIATNATLLADAQWIVVTTSTGLREPARVVAVDSASDIGLLRVSSVLPVARFAGSNQVQPGAGAVEMGVSSSAPGTATTVWSSGTIASADDAVG